MRQGTVCVVGSINADRYVGLARLPKPGETVLGAGLGLFPGGKGLNQIIAAARAGAEARMCGTVGSDPEAGFLRNTMRDAGVNGDYVRAVDEATGAAYIFSLPNAENSIVVASGANARVREADARAAVRGASVVLVQLEVTPEVARAALKAGRDTGAITILNAAPAHPAAIEMLQFADVLVVNEEEAEALGGVSALAESTTVIRTLGALGCTVHPLGSEAYRVPAFRSEAVDTTGSGDAFCGALAAALARGATLAEAVRSGAAAGAIVASHVGAQTVALTSEAIAELVAS